MREPLRTLLLWLLRKTRPPYECYWRDQAKYHRAEAIFWRTLAEHRSDKIGRMQVLLSRETGQGGAPARPFFGKTHRKVAKAGNLRL